MIKLTVLQSKTLKIILISAFIFLTGYLFISSAIADETGLKAEKYNPKTDKLVTPTIQDIQNSITLTGFVDAQDKAILRFQTSGKLTWVGAKVGDRVKRWQAIASLDKQDLTKRFQKEANDYLTNRSTFEDLQDQYQSTRDNHLITDEIQRILDRQQYSLNNAVLDYELADLAVKYATISSPINGIVTSIDTPNPGINVSPTTSAFTIVDPDSIFFSTEIDEEDVNKLSIDQSAQITIDSFPDNLIDSKIFYISFEPIAGKSSTVYLVKLKLDIDNSDLTYRLGMNGDANIVLQQAKDSLTVPFEAIVEIEDQKYVLIKLDKTSQLIQVKTGIESDDYIQILEGLTGNEQIIIKG